MTYAFGTDGIDRYVRVYRKENAPCEDELAVRRRGEPWNDQIKHQIAEKVEDSIEHLSILKQASHF